MDKKKVTLSVIAIAVLLVVLVGSTYAYWTLNGTPKTSANVQVQTGGLILRLDDVNGITSNDVIDPNNLSFSKYFSITNESAADGYAKILFKGLTNTFVSDALVYDLEEVQANKASYTTPRMIITNEVVPKVSNANATLADGLLIEKGTISGNTVTPNTKYYKVTVRYKYSDTIDQSEDVGATLVSGFTIEEGSEKNVEVLFNSGEGVVNPEGVNVTFGGTYSNLPVVTKSGYKFEGWYLDREYKNKVENGSKVTKYTNHTLYAKWNEKGQVLCVNESGVEIDCPKTLAIGQRMKIGSEYFRYIRTTNTADTTHTYNECQDGGSASIACSDADSRHPLVNNQLRLLAEYNLNVGDNKNTSVTEGVQHESVRGYRGNEGTMYGNIAYGASNNNYSQSYVKSYTENYANYLNTTYFGGTSEVSGSAITYEELVMLGCSRVVGNGACSSAPSWVKSTSYWPGSPYNIADVWVVLSYGGLSYYDYTYDDGFGVRPVISISASSI